MIHLSIIWEYQEFALIWQRSRILRKKAASKIQEVSQRDDDVVEKKEVYYEWCQTTKKV